MMAVAALVAVSALFAPPARAQEEPKPIRLFLGAFFPSDSDTADAVGSTEFSWGLSYDLPQKKPSPATLAVYFDGVWADSSEVGDLAVRFHYLGIGPEARYYPAKKKQGGEAKANQFYLGGGFGFYYITAQIVDDGFYVENIDNDFKFGGKLLAGMDFGKSLCLEGDYTWPGTSAGQGWNLRLGFRF
jgi:hypothetical protein